MGDRVDTIGKNAFEDCYSLATVYYKGAATKWDMMELEEGNTLFTEATRYYYSETQPTAEGNYWHYVNGVPTIW